MANNDSHGAGVPQNRASCPFHQWDEDFPVEWADDEYITRRELTKFLTLGSALLAGSSCLVALLGMRPEEDTFPAARIAAADDIAPGSSLLFRYPTDRDACILVRELSGDYQAYSQVCTHLACAVVYRSQDNVLFCPCHNGGFSVEAGAPVFGPPQRRLPRIRLEQRGADIFAVGVEI